MTKVEYKRVELPFKLRLCTLLVPQNLIPFENKSSKETYSNLPLIKGLSMFLVPELWLKIGIRPWSKL